MSNSGSTTSIPMRPNVNIEVLKVFLEHIRLGNVDLILSMPSTQRLYHYTDLNGLHGIVQNHDLWMTHSRYSNDDEEMTHGYKVVKQVIEAERANTQDPLRSLYLERLGALLDEPIPEGVYICCFCEQDNLLSQWRSYGANGTGVSIEIDPMGFSYITGPEYPFGLLRLWQISYEPERQTRIVMNAIEFAPNYLPGGAPEDWARIAADALQFFIPTFKNQDFREENEWRLIFTPAAYCPVKPRFRVGRNMLVPFYSLRDLINVLNAAMPLLPTLPICGVRVGPSPHKHLNLESAQMFLAQHDYPGVRVDASLTPYRG